MELAFSLNSSAWRKIAMPSSLDWAEPIEVIRNKMKLKNTMQANVLFNVPPFLKKVVFKSLSLQQLRGGKLQFPHIDPRS
jgi:hypothetical protein